MTDLLAHCPTCGQEPPTAPQGPPGVPGGPEDDGWWEEARGAVAEHPLTRMRVHVWLRRLVVAGHTAVTGWLLFTHQVSLAWAPRGPWSSWTPWAGPAVAGACALVALFISATAIRGRWWPWLWAAAGWVAPVAAFAPPGRASRRTLTA